MGEVSARKACSVFNQWNCTAAHGEEVADVHGRVRQTSQVREIPVQDLLVPAA